ncbi:MAG: hypothetical protein J2P43_06020, partial [Candidatus Dormibacteraeota bacterium]|nr:hypothetical protein [Candidatus Dormibacteraeota bacterium]
MDLPKTNRRQFIQLGGVAGAGMIIPVGVWRALAAGSQHPVTDPQTAIDPTKIPQFVTALPTFVGKRIDSASYTVSIQEFRQQVLPASVYSGLNPPFNQGTYLWGHRNASTQPSWPGTTVIAHRGTPTTATYVNNLPTIPKSVVEPFLPMDQTLMWANPLNTAPSNAIYQGPVPTAIHLHGAEVPSEFDGTSNEWFTQTGIHGKGYSTLRPTAPNAAVYQYPNTQQTLAMMFHPHERGLTRTSVYAGMASQ